MTRTGTRADKRDAAQTGSRERAIRAMARLLRHRGYAGTGLQHVVAEAGAPIGSLYHHFPGGKAALAAEAVTSAGSDLGARLGTLLERTDAATALRMIAAAMGDDLRRSKWKSGCPIAATALERGAEDATIRKAVDGVFRGWEKRFAERLANEGFPPEVAARLAVLMVASLEGALILARSRRSTAPLEAAARSLAELVHATAPTPRSKH